MDENEALAELRSYRVIKLDIEDKQARLRTLNSGMIHSVVFGANVGKSHAAENGIEKRYIEIIEEKERLEKMIAGSKKRLKDIESYISSIYDRTTRYIFEQHIYNGKRFIEIAIQLDDRPTVDGVKRRVYRYLDEHPFI